MVQNDLFKFNRFVSFDVLLTVPAADVELVKSPHRLLAETHCGISNVAYTRNKKRTYIDIPLTHYP
jgi:hypothetical protein